MMFHYSQMVFNYSQIMFNYSRMMFNYSQMMFTYSNTMFKYPWIVFNYLWIMLTFLSHFLNFWHVLFAWIAYPSLWVWYSCMQLLHVSFMSIQFVLFSWKSSTCTSHVHEPLVNRSMFWNRVTPYLCPHKSSSKIETKKSSTLKKFLAMLQ